MYGPRTKLAGGGGGATFVKIAFSFSGVVDTVAELEMSRDLALSYSRIKPEHTNFGSETILWKETVCY